MDIIQKLTEEFKLKNEQVEKTVALIDEGNTIPFIARYRKEVTGSLDDTVLRDLNDRLSYLRSLDKRREEVRSSITEQGKMTDEINAAIDNAEILTELEDIYRPFKPHRKTRASVAREKGLEGLAELIMKQEKEYSPSIEEVAVEYINGEKEVLTVEDALQGANDIIAEDISDNAEFRKEIKHLAKKYRSIPEDLIELRTRLMDNPFEGVDLGMGVRKVRMSIKSKGKGKSGGARVITYSLTADDEDINLTLLTIYDKSERSTISDKEIKDLLKSI